jgi:hypothetical protein
VCRLLILCAGYDCVQAIIIVCRLQEPLISYCVCAGFKSRHGLPSHISEETSADSHGSTIIFGGGPSDARGNCDAQVCVCAF